MYLPNIISLALATAYLLDTIGAVPRYISVLMLKNQSSKYYKVLPV